jgi:PKD repeat protein
MKTIVRVVLMFTVLLTATVEAAYIKVDANGNALSDSATSWSCVYDDVNQLLWEVKTVDGGIHDKDNTYRWGGAAELSIGGDNYGDWDTLVNGTNSETLCGQSDWGVSSIYQLRDLKLTGIDTDYFPNTNLTWYWSSSTHADYSDRALILRFAIGGNGSSSIKSNDLYARLVRGGQLFAEPQANFTYTPTTPSTTQTITLDGSSSSGNDGTSDSILSYQWISSDGQTASGSTASSFSYTTSGSYTVTLIITDNHEQTTSSSQTITVEAQLPPVASFTTSTHSGAAPLTIVLNGSGSTDSDGTITSYSWSSSDGQSATGSTASLQLTAAGSYTVTLTVTDDFGATDTTIETITVTEPANLSPTALFSASPNSGTVPLTVVLDGSSSTDSDGTISSYRWTSSDGLKLPPILGQQLKTIFCA